MSSAVLFDLPASAENSAAMRPAAPKNPGRRSYDDVDRVTYLGTHQPSWLARPEFGEDCVPLCVANHRLSGRKTLPRAVTPWMLDSGGFTELSKYGQWTVTPYEYAAAARRYYDEISMMDVCAIQDWMCEDEILAKTGLTVERHQYKTVASFLNLMTLDADLPWMPVLQGFTLDDYLRCVDQYEQAGVDLTLEPVVGIRVRVPSADHGRGRTDHRDPVVHGHPPPRVRLQGHRSPRGVPPALLLGLPCVEPERHQAGPDARVHAPALRELPAVRPGVAEPSPELPPRSPAAPHADRLIHQPSGASTRAPRATGG
ncbi:deazapurine DNA modification protein DpdA family protein [Streptomyces spongiicola]|uniref:deazapurine DNA modification protein DpdA family protein n=1 Tax=Streptomyces spongiicola TaxID=1690221 RepID=UPI0011C1796E|nr:hypothetical protein [Streptomyces spongiicola]